MARQKGMLNLSGNIEVNAGAPFDARDIVPTKADLTASGNFPYAYVGMETYVVAENKKYRYMGGGTTNLSNWSEVGSGGGESEFSKTTLFSSDTDVVNITLSDSIENYDAISIIAGFTDSGGHQRYTSTFYTDTLMANAGENVNYGTTNDASYVHFKVIDATHLERTHRKNMNIEKILGVTYGGTSTLIPAETEVF